MVHGIPAEQVVEAINSKISNNAAVIGWLSSYNSGESGGRDDAQINVIYDGENGDDWQ